MPRGLAGAETLTDGPADTVDEAAGVDELGALYDLCLVNISGGFLDVVLVAEYGPVL